MGSSVTGAKELASNCDQIFDVRGAPTTSMEIAYLGEGLLRLLSSASPLPLSMEERSQAFGGRRNAQPDARSHRIPLSARCVAGALACLALLAGHGDVQRGSGSALVGLLQRLQQRRGHVWLGVQERVAIDGWSCMLIHTPTSHLWCEVVAAWVASV